MALNQGEGFSAGFGFYTWSLRERYDKVDRFGDFSGLDCEKQELDDDDHKGGKSDEIADLLPPDPFNMESITQDTGWSEDFEKDFHCDKDVGNPSDALLLALGYLDLRDLLVVEGVCKTLRDAVIEDPLLWKSIHIDFPFCTKITNDILIKLTNRAQGHLHSLSLVHCSKITDAGLKHVLDRNPNLSKLNVPGCAKLTADGMLYNLKVLKAAGKMRLKYLGIYGLYGMTNQNIEEFKLLIGVDNSKLPTTRKPRFFGGAHLCVTSDDDRAMDVEVCPKCQRLELVYDCPSESCQTKQSASQLCRACTKCITRCIDCGCCLINCDYVELLHFELLCLDCQRKSLSWRKGELELLFLDCRRKPLSWRKGEQEIPFYSETTVVHKGEGYHFYLYG